jgi:excisionase family DNA binding protein
MTEQQVEAWLGVVELWVRGPKAASATGTAAPAQQGSAPASDVPSPDVASASPGAAALSPARPTYTAPEAARLLGMNESTLRERIRMRRVPVLCLGRRVLLSSTTVERLLASGEARPRR